jgi:hypothetical protein
MTMMHLAERWRTTFLYFLHHGDDGFDSGVTGWVPLRKSSASLYVFFVALCTSLGRHQSDL